MYVRNRFIDHMTTQVLEIFRPCCSINLLRNTSEWPTTTRQNIAFLEHTLFSMQLLYFSGARMILCLWKHPHLFYVAAYWQWSYTQRSLWCDSRPCQLRATLPVTERKRCHLSSQMTPFRHMNEWYSVTAFAWRQHHMNNVISAYIVINRRTAEWYM